MISHHKATCVKIFRYTMVNFKKCNLINLDSAPFRSSIVLVTLHILQFNFVIVFYILQIFIRATIFVSSWSRQSLSNLTNLRDWTVAEDLQVTRRQLRTLTAPDIWVDPPPSDAAADPPTPRATPGIPTPGGITPELTLTVVVVVVVILETTSSHPQLGATVLREAVLDTGLGLERPPATAGPRLPWRLRPETTV